MSDYARLAVWIIILIIFVIILWRKTINKINMFPAISYVVTACNEINELKILFPKLIKFYNPQEDEIIIQLDTNRTQEVFDYVKGIENTGVGIKVIEYPLNGDFASFKNNFIYHCNKQIILQLDADEVPHDNLLLTIKEILFNNPEIDVYAVPRINIVPGIETRKDLILQWGWSVNEKNWINHPDYQIRIWKNKPEIKWVGKVHEKLEGYQTYSVLPFTTEDYSLIHIKQLDRQIRQNQFYGNISQ